ncbi:MAG: spermidine/putrescine transport system ATP-binding protein, partial [Pseudonocardiales bacterium]|nr:spermidine/putrescine transport system ATP-binding protein [Pseudonocardiales bacterium]
RLVVMNAGHIEQLGAPREVYERPRTRFVAGFIGTSNLMTGRVGQLDGSTAVLDCGASESLVVPDAIGAGAAVGQPLDLTVRPEKIVISQQDPTAGWCRVRGRVSEVVYLGTSTQYAVRTADGTELTVFLQNASDASDVAERGSDVWLSWRPEHSLALAASAGPDIAAESVA